ncbi:MAG: ribbon-helix-helix protein, CopG family [Rothia sp. (in: high G+C Gram-positive bacteria)]|nr:ribbon-helix-helix protein, CopG family [Rothia sp. (in: high G+C Gram-positive bacteria)]
MSTKDNAYYDAFSEEIEAGNIDIDNSNIQRGNKLGLDLILAATGASNEEEALAMFAPGRPQVGKERGVSPSIRARVPQQLKDSIALLAARQGKKESEIVRLAVAEYVKAHAA